MSGAQGAYNLVRKLKICIGLFPIKKFITLGVASSLGGTATRHNDNVLISLKLAILCIRGISQIYIYAIFAFFFVTFMGYRG